MKTLQERERLSQLRAELIPRKDVGRMFSERVGEVEAGLLTLPEVAPRLAHRDADWIEAELEAAVRTLLERFAAGERMANAPRGV